ncbi:SDR family oxidoreductase [Streptomyces sp. CMB-StM0423]|uniref:SDR family oxidoreductase n=1 Tax=Streptomyces sp. CMB-StM0423 TaxID=2059884 RepID=UPI000C711C49|nr:NAD(P)H-binding protein [Streptomyces sp. CMB-StM0423]AUH39561.1 NmrA family transcriptional regulator [Streptomyces sp. CMB-StM0423]
MSEPILVTGGTGTLGRQVVWRLRDAGRDVRVLSRRAQEGAAKVPGVEYVQGDLLKDQGIAEALDGVRTVMHCASDKKGDEKATANLVRAAGALPEAPHLLYVSIVGVDDVTFGYFKSKRDSERVITDSALPWTIMRATQFYDLILKGAKSGARFPVVPVPAGFLVQPIDPDEVAARLVELALGEPAGRVPDMAGPEVTSAADLIKRYLHANSRRKKVLQLWMPGLGKIKEGKLLVQDGEGQDGRRTWEEFLAAKAGA